MADLYTHYEKGVRELIRRLGRKHPRFIEVLTLQTRLHENVQRARHFADDPANQAARTEIIARLQFLVYEEFEEQNLTFTDLCDEAMRLASSPTQPAPQPQPALAPAPAPDIVIPPVVRAQRIKRSNSPPPLNSVAVIPPVVRAQRINPLFPVTLAEWRDELTLCNKDFGKPAGYWCYVRPGSYLIGGWEKGDPVDTITLPGFWIAKYPITVQQYRQFIQAGGYTNERYWTPNGWKWKEGNKRTNPYFWPGANEDKEGRFNVEENQPVTTISWYEAAAVARWLTVELADALPAGHCIRLPTEAEWEAAAAYDSEGRRRTYPWGDSPEPDRSRADFGKDYNREGPAPVGERPAGAAACGAEDLVGRVWGWTASRWESYAAGSGTVGEDFPTDTKVSFRGHAYYGNRTDVRCGSRDWLYAGYDGSFRLFLPSH